MAQEDDRPDLAQMTLPVLDRIWRLWNELTATSDESTGDKQAIAVTRAWQDSVASKDIQCEVPIKEGLNEKIDVIDFLTATAYEMKVSGNNPHHEFYKGIFKIIVYNQDHDKRLERLVFITEKHGADMLNRGLGKAVIQSLAQYKLLITAVEI